MQEGTTDRRGRSHPLQCTTSREDRQIVRMAVTDRSVTSRTITQNIESVTHHSVSARTIRRRLQQSDLSAGRPLLGIPLTQKNRRLLHQWCVERRITHYRFFKQPAQHLRGVGASCPSLPSGAVDSLVVRASDSRTGCLGSVTKCTPSTCLLNQWVCLVGGRSRNQGCRVLENVSLPSSWMGTGGVAISRVEVQPF
ncbi:HTH_Tnp_Tc3_2 domain-containing protein [Trichonephila clavipes]|uniref:HTH_Tnp_Tc3_2 domain-containing protein n=1 Tax=Trichonephila clavipes TaxID=2585209 RepID=A0A8X6R647_TRICX|nr:HTH_Tnp_Tc3_2 domain-containing protein [Trichonephila clavipes]